MDTQLIVRLIVALLTAVNTVCTMAGFPIIDLGEDQITVVVNVVITIVGWAFSAWSNFNVTKAAKEGQKVTNALKSGSISADDVDSLVQ